MICLLQSNDLEKAYPPFINFFENTRDMLVKCDKTKPRFHAFLKLRQSRQECGRQSLQDLLIRPVQRLPSVNLLLNGTSFVRFSELVFRLQKQCVAAYVVLALELRRIRLIRRKLQDLSDVKY